LVHSLCRSIVSQHGRKKAIWLSISSDLVFDSKRDLRDIDAHIPLELLSKVGCFLSALGD
jgi:hypothetical protein